VLKNGFDINAVLAGWQWWIFKELPFPYMVNKLFLYYTQKSSFKIFLYYIMLLIYFQKMKPTGCSNKK